jgi:hypothetical protein
VTVVIDATVIYALADSREPSHTDCLAAFERLADERVAVSPFALQEADYLVQTRLGIEAELSLLNDVGRGVLELATFGAADIDECLEVVRRYRSLDVGLAGASNVVLAERLRTKRMLTLDRRHFETMRPRAGGRFEILPAPRR